MVLERRTRRGANDARPTEIYRRAVTIFLVFAVVTATVLGLLLAHLKDNARADGRRLATAFALLAQEQSVARIQAIEQTLELAESRLSIAPGARQAVLAALANDRAGLQGLFLLDAEGGVVASSDAAQSSEARLGSYFRRHRDRLVGGFAIGGLMRDGSGAWTIPATLPIRDAGGRVQGFVLGLIAPRMFERAWQADAGAGYQVELARTDGTVLMRIPLEQGAAANDSLAAALLETSRQASAGDAGDGSFEARGPDGAAMLVVFRRLDEYPGLVASIGISMAQVLKEWREIAQYVVIGWVLGIVAVIFFTVWAVRISVARWRAQRRYRLLFQANPYAILIAEPGTWRLLAANDAALKQYGWPLEELLTMTIADISASGADPAVTSGQFVHHARDGTPIDVEISARPVEYAGRPAVMAIAHDVSQRVRLEAARQAAEEKLRQAQKMEAVGQLTGGVAHDLNNILTIILANMDALQEEEKAGLPAAVARRLDRVVGAALRAADLTRQLLAFSRKQPLRPEVTDLGELVAQLSQLLLRSLGAHIRIEVRAAAGLAAVDVDRAQLETALLNLCVNARDAMPKGGTLLIEAGNVELGEEFAARHDIAAGAYARIAISDSGSGIPREVMPRIFEPFFTTKEVGKGTGLGLSMVYGFIKQSKGHINVYSEPGRGTTFKIYLPAVAWPAGARDVPAAAPAAAPIAGGRERILVVEDEEGVRETILQELASLGYAVAPAASASEALAVAERQGAPFDLVLTDLVLPGPYSGPELADAIAARWPATRIVFMSGYTQDAVASHGDPAAGTRLLTKPFSKRELARAVRQALDA